MRRTLALLGVLVAVLLLIPASALARDLFSGDSAPPKAFPGRVFVDCVVRVDGGYQAVFGYHNTSSESFEVPLSGVGDWQNTVSPAELGGDQVTRFEPGLHHGAFTTRTAAEGAEVVWEVGSPTSGVYAIATSGSPVCGTAGVVAAEGNGLGSALLTIASLPIAVGAVLLASSRRRNRS